MKTMGSKAPPKVPFGALVETGMIVPGTTLTDARRRWQARVLADASIEHGGEQGSIHRVGAAVQGAELQRLDVLAFRGGGRAVAARYVAPALSRGDDVTDGLKVRRRSL